MSFPMMITTCVVGVIGIATLPFAFVANFHDGYCWDLPGILSRSCGKPMEGSYDAEMQTLRTSPSSGHENSAWGMAPTWLEKGGSMIGVFLFYLLISPWIEDIYENLNQHPFMRQFFLECRLALSTFILNLRRLVTGTSSKKQCHPPAMMSPSPKKRTPEKCTQMDSNRELNLDDKQETRHFIPKHNFYMAAPGDGELRTCVDFTGHYTLDKMKTKHRIRPLYTSCSSPRILPRSKITASKLLVSNMSNEMMPKK